MRFQAQDKALHRQAKGKPAVSQNRARSMEVTEDEEEDTGDEHGRLKKIWGNLAVLSPQQKEGKKNLRYTTQLLVVNRQNYKLEGLQWMVQNGISGISGAGSSAALRLI